MDTKDLIRAEIDRVDATHLDELYRVVKDFAETRSAEKRPGVLGYLRQVKVELPEDFAASLDDYAFEERQES